MNQEKWNKIDLFIETEKDPLKKYGLYFTKIEFNKFNYSFIIPEQLSDLFSSVYTKILKDSFIIFPNDFKQAEELIDDYENEADNKKSWILISPCMELEKNIKAFHEKKNIICFFGYCPIFNHSQSHDELFFYSFSKFYGIFDSCEELIENLFELSNVFYYRNKQKYEINNNVNIIELNYDSKYLIDIIDDTQKEPIMNEKLNSYFRFKISNSQCYFTFIKSFNLIDKYIEENDYDSLLNTFRFLENFIISYDNSIEKRFLSVIFLKNLHLLLLYFSNYHYLYGILTDEEINQIISTFKHEMDESELKTNIISSFDSLTTVVNTLANEVNKGHPRI